MPSLRIPFPEKEASSTLVLKGAHLTIGRRPNNTVQILDRTISGAHAEFVAEPDGHYRLHDLGSTNGTFVNGETVTDFHLVEACTVSFGSVACEFDPAAVSEAMKGEVEVLATRGEMETVRRANEELNRNLVVLREEVASLKGAQVAATGEADTDMLKAELQRVVVERGELKEAAEKHLLELARLQSELALVKRDRANLQNALRMANGAELDRVKREQAGQAAKTAAAATETSGVLVGAAAQMAAAMNVTPSQSAAPHVPAKPLSPVSQPSLPPPSAPSFAASQNGRPAPPAGVATKLAAPLAARPVARAVPQAVPRAPVAVARPAGPTGTQKIAPPSSTAGLDRSIAARPSAAAVAKLPPKFVPPVRAVAKPEESEA